MSAFNVQVIEEFRANGGHVSTGGFGDSLILIHSVGARSGRERVNPAMSLKIGTDRLVIASAAGALTNPAWCHNLRAHPDIVIETPGGYVEVTASELDGAEYEAAWRKFDAASPAFGEYQRRAGRRRLPIFRLRPRAAAVAPSADASRRV